METTRHAKTADRSRSGIGYFEAGSTRLAAVDECAILSPRLADTFARLRTLVATTKSLPAIDEIEAFADSADEKILLNLSAERLTGSAEAIASSLRQAIPNVESILVQDRRADKFELFGPGYIDYSVAGTAYRVGHLSFFQVNRFLIDALIEAVLGDSKGRLALDLFAGVGLFHRASYQAIRSRHRCRIESCGCERSRSKSSVQRRKVHRPP